jgi:hypothetical protein
MELICKRECRKPYTFVQQVCYHHHFLPLCDCEGNPYITIPDHIPESQYEQYMSLATTNKNKVLFLEEKYK